LECGGCGHRTQKRKLTSARDHRILVSMTSRQTRLKVWFVLVDAFWLYVWFPGFHETLRLEDVVSVVAFSLGIVFELLGLWVARIINVGFYLFYAVVVLVLYLRDRSDPHLALGLVLLVLPYVLIGLINLYLYRTARS
jgi:hypothetical protein